MEKIIHCYHLLSLDQASGVEDLVRVGRLKVSACGICDDRVPLLVDYAVGQDVSCVGPDDPLCPDPSEAIVVIDD